MSKHPTDQPTSADLKHPRTERRDESLYGDDLGVGALVGNYVIEELRSRGGFATVYRAKHVAIGRRAALKVLHKDLVRSQDMIERFRREARAVNLIRHPNIVDIYEYGELMDGRPYFVMEWLDGHDLEHHLRSHGPMNVHEALAVMEELGAALEVAHAAGVIHRDIKASNVVLVLAADWFDVKLVDFGIAKMLAPEDGSDLSLTRTGTRLGTPWNMAPEQIMLRAVDARTDIYALGVLLYEMLTGKLPFRSKNEVEIEEMHLSRPPPRAGEVAPVPPAVDDVIQRCMQKRPELRFQTVRDMVNELRRAVVSADAPGVEESAMVEAIGLYVDARGEVDVDGAVEERMLDALDWVGAETRRVLEAQNMTLAVDTAEALLGVVPLPADAAAGRMLREHALRIALDLARTFEARLGAEGLVHVAVCVHAAPALRRAAGDGVEYLGGELLDLGAWAARAPVDGVSATTALLADLQGRVVTAPVEHCPGLARVKSIHV